MTAAFSGPSLLIHILLVTMLNALFFPLIIGWAGSILYAFLISVALLAVYGWLVLRLAAWRQAALAQPSPHDAEQRK